MVSGSGLKRGKEEWSEVIMENGVRRGINLANLASCSRVLGTGTVTLHRLKA